MKPYISYKYTSFLFIGFLYLISYSFTGYSEQETALDEYIKKPDPTYNYQVLSTEKFPGFSLVTMHMDSLTWRTLDEVDRNIWQHQLITIIPDNINPNHKNSLMWIGAGSNKTNNEKKFDPVLLSVALATQSMVTEIKMIPNQPIKFSDEKDPRYKERGRKEDELIAYAWDKHLTTYDYTWLPRLPMTKAVVRAMDTIQSEYAHVEGFVVAGASKRGWTAWTTAAVDSRVVAVAPLVIDTPNVVKTMQHHFDVYGYWSDAIHDYEDMGLMDKLQTKAFKRMMKIVDPYYYFDRLDMPKFIINATGDQFFLPDSSQYYFNKLKNEKYLRYVPNTDHGLNQEAIKDFSAFYYSFLNKQQRPKYVWKKYPNGTLKVKTDTTPTIVRLWQANNPSERNFRLDTIGEAWTSTELTPERQGVYIGKIPTPENGWSAFMIELEYATDTPFPLRVTTEVSVIGSEESQDQYIRQDVIDE